MKLSLSPPPYADAPVVVLISGLGGSGSYWLPQLAVLVQEYQVVCYDQRGTGNNPDTLAIIPTRWQKITVSPRWQRNCIRRW